MHSSQGSDFLASSSKRRQKGSPVLSLLNSHMVMYATARFWAQVKAVGVFLVGVQQNRRLPIQPACMPRPCVSLQDPLSPHHRSPPRLQPAFTLHATCGILNLTTLLTTPSEMPTTLLRATFGQHFVSRLSGAAFLIATRRNSCWLHFLLKDRSEKLKSARMSDHLTPTCKYLISVNHIAQPFILLLCSP